VRDLLHRSAFSSLIGAPRFPVLSFLLPPPPNSPAVQFLSDPFLTVPPLPSPVFLNTPQKHLTFLSVPRLVPLGLVLFCSVFLCGSHNKLAPPSHRPSFL